MIKLEDCRHGYAYEIHSRNLVLGVFDASRKGFVGIRNKFGDEFLFCEFHADTGDPYGTVEPQVEIEKCPVQNIQEDLGTICQACREPVEYRKDPATAPYGGKWTHLVQAGCEKELAVGRPNKELLEYLKELGSRKVYKRSRGPSGNMEEIWRRRYP